MSEKTFEQIQREKRERRIRENTARVNAHNANLVPDHPGYVRTTGPRRQSRGSVDSNGFITWTEI